MKHSLGRVGYDDCRRHIGAVGNLLKSLHGYGRPSYVVNSSRYFTIMPEPSATTAPGETASWAIKKEFADELALQKAAMPASLIVIERCRLVRVLIRALQVEAERRCPLDLPARCLLGTSQFSSFPSIPVLLRVSSFFLIGRQCCEAPLF